MTSADQVQAQRIAEEILTAQARRRRTRWATAASAVGVIAVALPLAVALQRPASDGRPVADRTVPTGGTVPSGTTGPAGTTGSNRHRGVPAEAGVYAAVLGGRPQRNVGSYAKPVYVHEEFCTGMIDIEDGKRGPCAAGPIPARMQQDIRAIAGDQIRFTDNPPQPTLHSPVVRIGTATVIGDRAQVAIDVQCGPLCGEGQTMILTRHGDTWRASGATGYSWIS